MQIEYDNPPQKNKLPLQKLLLKIDERRKTESYQGHFDVLRFYLSWFPLSVQWFASLVVYWVRRMRTFGAKLEGRNQ